jgi:hypothetical protein
LWVGFTPTHRSDRAMSGLLERVLSVGTLRTVIRSKCCAGVSGQTISALIASYVRADLVAESPRYGRLPVELIDPDLRVAFLEALQRLPVNRSPAYSEIAPLRH